MAASHGAEIAQRLTGSTRCVESLMVVAAVDHGSDKNGADDGIWEWITAGARRACWRLQEDGRRAEDGSRGCGRLRDAVRMRDAGGRTRGVDTYTTNIISSRVISSRDM
jgi:hypothetical protein